MTVSPFTLETPDPVVEAFDGMTIDHIEFYVEDLPAKAAWLIESFDLTVYGANARSTEVRSVGLGRNDIRLVLTEPLISDHPGAAYLERHGDGIADIALGVPDAVAAYDLAVARGARPVAGPAVHGDLVTATIMGFGDVAHTFVQRTGDAGVHELPGLRLGEAPVEDGSGLGIVDHIAVAIVPGELDATVAFYQDVLSFELIFTERIVIGNQAMTTTVVQSPSRGVTFTLIEPDRSRVAGHVDEFLKDHGGPGVQHLAFTADNILTSVAEIGARGVEFLSTPDTYYTLLPTRVELDKYPLEELHRLNILVDSDHDGQLYQIFAKSVHPRNTFFFEVIERMGARSFGSGNIAALYQAVELQRGNDGGAL